MSGFTGAALLRLWQKRSFVLSGLDPAVHREWSTWAVPSGRRRGSRRRTSRGILSPPVPALSQKRNPLEGQQRAKKKIKINSIFIAFGTEWWWKKDPTYKQQMRSWSTLPCRVDREADRSGSTLTWCAPLRWRGPSPHFPPPIFWNVYLQIDNVSMWLFLRSTVLTRWLT